MGKLVTFWSPVAGQAKTTSSMIAIVSALAIGHPSFDIAIASVGKEESSLEDALAERSKWNGSSDLYGRSGMSALLLSCKQGVMTREKIRRCSLPVAFSEVSLFPGLKREIKVIHGKETEKLEYHILTNCIKEEYGLTFLDLRGGNSVESVQYMQAADLAVIVLPQNPSIWKCFWKEEKNWVDVKRQFVLFGGYIKNSKYGVAQYKRSQFGNLERRFGVVPLCEGYMDALADGKAMEFFLKNEYAGKRDENYEFMENVGKAAKGICESAFLS